MQDAWTLKHLSRHMAAGWMETEDQRLIDAAFDDLCEQAARVQAEIFAAREADDPAYGELRTAHFHIMRDVDALMPQSSVPF